MSISNYITLFNAGTRLQKEYRLVDPRHREFKAESVRHRSEGTVSFKLLPETGCLGEVFDIRSQLVAKPSTGMVLGKPRNDLIRLCDEGDIDDVSGFYTVPGKQKRNSKTFDDPNDRLFTVDFDGIKVDGCVMEDDARIETLIRDALAKANLDFLMDASFVVHFSASHGLDLKKFERATNQARFHCVFELHNPASLAFKKVIASYMEAQLMAAGNNKGCVDAGIYQTSRFMATAEPVFRGIKGRRIRPIQVERVRYFRGKNATVNTDGLKLESPKTYYVPDTGEYTHIDELQPGQVHEYLKQRICSIVRAAEFNELPKLEKKTLNGLYSAIRGMPDTTAARLEENKRQLPSLWAWAVETFHGTIVDTPAPATPEIPLHAARQQLNRTLMEAVALSLSDPTPQVYAIKATAGIGKTAGVLAALQSVDLSETSVIFASPTIELSQQSFDKACDELDCDVYIHIGREKSCLETHEGDPTWNDRCKKIEAVGMHSRSNVCGGCPLAETCRWYRDTVKKDAPGVHFIQHAHLERYLEEKLFKGTAEVAMIILDEGGKSDLYINEESHTLEKCRDMALAIRHPNVYTEADVRDSRTQLLDILQQYKGQSVVPTNAFSRFYAIDEVCEAEGEYALATTKRIEALVKEDKDAKVDNLLEQVAYSRAALSLFHAIWNSRKRESERVLGLRVTRAGAYELSYRIKTPPTIANRPCIILDGTMDFDITEALLDGIPMDRHEIMPKPHHYKATQLIGPHFGKRHFAEDDKVKKENERRVRRYIIQHAKGQSVVIAQKPIRQLLEGKLAIDGGFAHFNATRGINKFEKAQTGFVIGRPMMQPYKAEQTAEAVFQKAVTLTDSAFMDNTDALIPLKSGSTRKVENKRENHPDTNVNKIVNQVVIAELEQAIQRMRLLNRTERDDVHLHIFGNVPCLAVDTVLPWEGIKPDVKAVALSLSCFKRSPDWAGGWFEGMGGRAIEKECERSGMSRQWLLDNGFVRQKGGMWKKPDNC